MLSLVLFGLFACKGPDKTTATTDNTLVKQSPYVEYVAEQKPSIIEVIEEPGHEIHPDSLVNFYSQLGLQNPEVYQWNNHYVFYGVAEKSERLQRMITSVFPESEVKIYGDPFYEFNRKQCADTATANQWDHVLLTASLVADTVLQNEYLDYHASQQKDWPEVAKGFCQAGFQRLLLYKNNRQLMLVISIPKGSSLDELNPKTTENNPRVNDWNALMKKYQEGIPGTNKGEVWVLLKKVNNQ